MIDTGWMHPATSDSTPGNAQTVFAFTDNIFAQDGANAGTSQSKFDNGETPENGLTLKATNFSFTIPDGATILGIETRIFGACATIPNMAYLGQTGGSPILPIGMQKEYHWSPPTNIPAEFIWGSPTDLWGTNNLSPATINSVDFGWVWMIWDSANPLSSSIDVMQMKIYYEELQAAAMMGAGF